MLSLSDTIEIQELIQKLVDNGYTELVDALSENKVYTKGGRLNKSGTCRVLGWKNKKLEDSIKECRRILGDDVF